MWESLPMFRRYFRLKAKLLGYEGGLRFYDLFAPVGRMAGDYSPEDARPRDPLTLEKVLSLALKGNEIATPADIIRDPYVFEFAGMPQLPVYTEGDLEAALIGNLRSFLLELGKGFAFVGEQQKLTIGSRFFKVDLVFYHRILKCFVLIDLKRGEVGHEDVGQMNLYLNYVREEMNTEGDTEPIGIILGAQQDRLVMRYALQHISNQLFVSRYQLYLPDREQLEAEFRRYMGGIDTEGGTT